VTAARARGPLGRKASPAMAASLLVVALASACQRGRDLPPPPADEPAKKDNGPPCGKVFRDTRVRGGSSCCGGPAAEVLKSADVMAACGLAAPVYLGETRDGNACRFHFQASGTEAKDSYIMLSRPLIPPGVPAPVAPDPLLPWKWKKVPLRDAIGYQALAAGDDPGLLGRQTVLWAGRGRRIVGLHVAKHLCNDDQAQALLQKAIDAVP
jgi:hypothetical protein